MTRFPSVALPESPAEPSGVPAALDSIQRWVRSAALQALVEEFDGPQLADDVGQALEQLDAFSLKRWDYRNGVERDLARDEDLNEKTVVLVLDAAVSLGLIGDAAPKWGAYDHVLVLGGLVRACIVRPQYARALIGDGLQVGTVTGLGAFRALSEGETKLAAGAGLVGAVNEVDAMEEGMSRAFGLADPASVDGRVELEQPNLSWRVVTFDTTPSVRIVAAPTTDEGRRANTPDTYAYWAEHVVKLGDAKRPRILLVTSAIYIPFQHADAIRMLALPYGAEVDTVGVDTAKLADPALRQTFKPTNYLQEVRSSIRSLRALQIELERAVTS